MKPLARWTIGPVSPDGMACLTQSIESFRKYHDVDVVICYNCERDRLPNQIASYQLIDQKPLGDGAVLKPKGVAWKLYPPRLDICRHEIVIDNDIIFGGRIDEIDQFCQSDSTLLLEGSSRTYGRFDKHVPPSLMINSGIYGMPPGYDLEKYVGFLGGTEWQKNAFAQHDKSETFDEQGLIAFALSNYSKTIIIPRTTVTNCEKNLEQGKAFHFIGLNRSSFHKPYRLYRHLTSKMYL